MDDLEEEYRNSLSDLRFNSKPLINTLTIIAEENIHAGSNIVRVIEEYLDQCNSTQKLPILYLIDSICKNTTSEYVVLFKRNLLKTFAKAYFSVDQTTKTEFLRVLKTWKSVFDEDLVDRIHNKINEDHQKNTKGTRESYGTYFSRKRSVERPPSNRGKKPQKNVEINPIELLDELKAFLATSKEAEYNLNSLKLDIPSISLDCTHLQRRYPGVHSFIYDNMSLQCRNCGIRFYDTERAKFDLHLDMHFKKASKAQSSRCLSRKWFLSEDEWINYSVNSSIDVTETAPKRLIDVSSASVRSEGVISCAICHEKFDSFWDFNEDEWMLKDAIKNKMDQICHLECSQE